MGPKINRRSNLRTRERSVNYTKQEEAALKAILRKYHEIIYNKNVDSKSLAIKRHVWSIIHEEYNNVAEVPRTLKQLKTKHENLKRLAMQHSSGKPIRAHKSNQSDEQSLTPSLYAQIEHPKLTQQSTERQKPESIESVDESTPDDKSDIITDEMLLESSDIEKDELTSEASSVQEKISSKTLEIKIRATERNSTISVKSSEDMSVDYSNDTQKPAGLISNPISDKLEHKRNVLTNDKQKDENQLLNLQVRFMKERMNEEIDRIKQTIVYEKRMFETHIEILELQKKKLLMEIGEIDKIKTVL